MTGLPTLTRSDIAAAADRIAPLVRTTPVLTVPGSTFGGTGTVSLKLELVQHSGSFKARGAASHLLAADPRPDGVVAASGGNHGAAVAWAARELGRPAHIFVPTISAPAKVDRLRAYGATVHQVGDVYAESLQASQAFLAEHDAESVHAYESPLVMAGAGTTGREFETQVPDLDTVLVACGGGGLVGGVATWFSAGPGGSATGPGHADTATGSTPPKPVAVVACETEGTAAYARALEADGPVPVAVTGIAADALGASSIGTLAWNRLRAAGAASVVVTDDEVVRAQHFLWDRFRVVTEPSAAVPVAAVLSGVIPLDDPDGHVGIIVCGANTASLPG